MLANSGIPAESWDIIYLKDYLDALLTRTAQ